MTSRLREDLEITGRLTVIDGIRSPLGNGLYANVGISPGQTFYVRTGGNDTTGDGLTVGTAWRQPQRAFDEIPDFATGYFAIDCGPGAFETPLFQRFWPSDALGLRIDVFADRSAPDLTIGTSLSWSQVAGYEARWRATTAGYGATITDNSHWVEISPSLAGASSESRPALDSSTPAIDVNSSQDPAAVVIEAIHPLGLTTFGEAANPNPAFPSPVGGAALAQSPGTGVASSILRFVGIEFTQNQVNLQHCGLSGGRLSATFTWLYNVTGSPIDAYKVDLDSGSLGFEIEYSSLQLTFVSCIAASPPANLVVADRSSTVSKGAGAVAGVCTGLPVELGIGCVGVDLSDCAVTNSGAPGDEIKVGVQAAQTFAAVSSAGGSNDFASGATSLGAVSS